MSKKLKRLIAAEYTEMLESIPACLVVNYQGVDAESSHAMRGDLKTTEPPIEFQVVKNSIAAHVMRQQGLNELPDLFDGPSALVFGGPGPVELSKKIVDWSKKVKKLQVQGGYLEGRGTLNADQVNDLSNIPTREQLLGQLASVTAGPIRNLAGGLQGIIRKLAYALNALKEERSEAA